MKLKLVCELTAGLVIASFLITMAGYVLSYLPGIAMHLSIKHLLSFSGAMLACLLGTIAFLIFLFAFIKQLNTSEICTELYILAGICCILATFAATGSNLIHVNEIFKHMSLYRCIFHIATMGVSFLGGILFTMFFLTKGRNTTLAKGLAAACLVISVILILSLFANVALYLSDYPFEHIAGNIMGFIGYILIIAGYFGHYIASLLFLAAFLTIQRPQMEFSEDGLTADYTD